MDFRIGDDIEEDKPKKNGGETFKIILVIIIALVFGLIVFLITNALFGKKEVPVEEVITTNLKVDDEKVTKAYKMVTYGANGKRNEIFLKNKEVHSEDFSNLQKFYFALQFCNRNDFTDTLEKNDKEQKIYVIPRNKIKSYITKFFGPDYSFEDDVDIKLTLPFDIDGNNVVSMKYNVDRDGYDTVFIDKDKYSFGIVEPFYGEVSEAKETSNGVLEIKENIIFTKATDQGNDTYDIGIYKDHARSEEIELIKGVTKDSLTEMPIKISNYSGRSGVVTYTFLKDGNSYYYVKSEVK